MTAKNDSTTTTTPRRAKGPSAPAPVESAPVEMSAPVESAPVESAPVESAPVESAPVAPVEMSAADRIGAVMLAATVADDGSAPVEMVENVTAILRTVRNRDRDTITAMLAESDAPGAIRRAVAALVTSVTFGADPGESVRTAWAESVARFATVTAHAAGSLPTDETTAALVAALAPFATAASADVWSTGSATVAAWSIGRGTRGTSGSATRSAPVLSGRSVPAGLALVATYRGATLTATTVADGESVVFRLASGETFSAASPAAVAAVKALGTFTGSRVSLRGTTFWHVGTVDGPTLADYVTTAPAA